MRRYSVLLQVFCVLMLVFTVSSESHAQTQHTVFYLTTDATITTYSVDGSGVPTQVGTPLTVPYPHIDDVVPGPNDRFLYVHWSDRANNYLWVYATDASGVPQSTPVQMLTFVPGLKLMVHKSGKYAYMLQITIDSQYQYSSTLYLYHVDPKTGTLTQDPQIQATYGPDPYYWESLVSFNKAGTRLYDLWSSSFRSTNNFFSYHPVNQSTGQLGSDVGTIFSTSNYGGFDETFFTTHLILNMHQDNFGNPWVLNVFQNVNNPKQPLFVCTQAMLNACGTATFQFWVSIDEHYVFLQDTSDTVIGHIDTPNQQIVPTGSIPGKPLLYFSPEDRFIYAVDKSSNVIQVYSFNPDDGTATALGSTTFSYKYGYGLYPALRQ
jgi:hypothetical protein